MKVYPRKMDGWKLQTRRGERKLESLIPGRNRLRYRFMIMDMTADSIWIKDPTKCSKIVGKMKDN